MTFCLHLSCFFAARSLCPLKESGEKNCVEVKNNCVVSPLHGRDMLCFFILFVVLFSSLSRKHAVNKLLVPESGNPLFVFRTFPLVLQNWS